jgi:hypothetical protein
MKPRPAHAPSGGVIFGPAFRQYFLSASIVFRTMVKQIFLVLLGYQIFGCGTLRVRHGILFRDELLHVGRIHCPVGLWRRK